MLAWVELLLQEGRDVSVDSQEKRETKALITRKGEEKRTLEKKENVSAAEKPRIEKKKASMLRWEEIWTASIISTTESDTKEKGREAVRLTVSFNSEKKEGVNRYIRKEEGRRLLHQFVAEKGKRLSLISGKAVEGLLHQGGWPPPALSGSPQQKGKWSSDRWRRKTSFFSARKKDAVLQVNLE